MDQISRRLARPLILRSSDCVDSESIETLQPDRFLLQLEPAPEHMLDQGAHVGQV